MAEIQLRDIQLTYDGDTLTISSLKDPQMSVSLDPGTVEDLVEFVHLFAPVDEDKPDAPNRREAFRVPVCEESGMKSMIITKGKQLKVRPTNISMTGVFIEVPKETADEFQVDDQVEVAMALEKWQVTLDAIVRRKQDHGYGLFFPATIKEEHVEPPPILRRIVMDLQRRWMLHRNHA